MTPVSPRATPLELVIVTTAISTSATRATSGLITPV
jgi:hypothetical protein